jgi:exosortase A-associated hydrolase 2
MIEEALFFPEPDRPLYGVVHEAATGLPVKMPFVFCHPFGEEKLWTHRVFVTFARALAGRGHPVLRFDFRGNGDSSGTFEASSVTTAREDLAAAIDWFRGRIGAERVGLLGLRLGATLASLTADARSDVGPAVLWAPIVDGDKYVQELLRINITTQMAVYKEIRVDRVGLAAQLRDGRTVNVDGYEMSLPMFEELTALRADAGPGTAGASRRLIVQIDRQPAAAPGPDTTRLHARYPDAEVRTVQEDPFWKEIKPFYETAPNLFAATLAWLEAP